MTGHADSEHFVKMAAAGSPRGAENIALADDIFSENVRTNGSAWAWPELNVGYKTGWRGSPVLRPRSWICSRQTTKSLRRLFGAEGIPDHMGATEATGKRVEIADFAVCASKMAK